MTLTNSTQLRAHPVAVEVAEDTIIEPGTVEMEATHLSDVSGMVTDSTYWVYSGTTEDNGTAGNLDGEQGLTYSGPSGVQVQVTVRDVDTIEHAITPPESTDKACLCIFKNSEVVGYADEGFTAHASEIAVEWNASTEVVLNEGDVLRVGMCFQGEEADADLDLAPGSLTII